jgi:hypothetical protein
MHDQDYEDENRETEIISACALRFDGYRYADDNNLVVYDELDTDEGTIPITDYRHVVRGFLDHPDFSLPHDYLCLVLFLIQRGWLRERWMDWRSYEAKITRLLFLALCQDDISPTHRLSDYADEWDREYQPHLDSIISFVKKRHTDTQYKPRESQN